MDQHQPITIENIKGLWSRDPTLGSVPQDHLSVSTNVDFFGSFPIVRMPFSTKYTFDLGSGVVPIRIFHFSYFDSQASVLYNQYLISTTDGDLYMYDVSDGSIGLIYSALAGYDYDFSMWGNRCYIAVSYYGYCGNAVDYPLQIWNGVSIRDAGGNAPTANFVNTASGTGVVQAGNHFYGICFETDTGFITPPGLTATPTTALVTNGSQSVSLTSIPTGDSTVVARWVVATKTIPSVIPSSFLYSYQIFFLQRIGDNTTTSATLNYYDSQLLNDASYLLDIYNGTGAAPIPGGSSLCVYHNRLVITAPSIDHVSDVLYSRINDPETFDSVQGIQTIDVQSEVATDVITTGFVDSQVFRDTLYLTKLFSTYGTSDTGQEPAFWPVNVIDSSYGSYRHGIADTAHAGESVDYLLIANNSGLFLFTGYFNRPEVSWKVQLTWQINLDLNSRQAYTSLHNDTFRKKIYFNSRTASGAQVETYMCDYNDVPSDFSGYRDLVRWSLWNFVATFSAFCLVYDADGVHYLAGNNTEISQLLNVGDSIDGIPIESGITMTFRTAEFRGSDEGMLHVNKVRLRVSNSSNPSSSITTSQINVYGTEGQPIAQLPNLTFGLNSGNSIIEPTILTNLLSQRLSFEIIITDQNPTLVIQKLILFAKETYRTLPYQYK